MASPAISSMSIRSFAASARVTGSLSVVGQRLAQSGKPVLRDVEADRRSDSPSNRSRISAPGPRDPRRFGEIEDQRDLGGDLGVLCQSHLVEDAHRVVGQPFGVALLECGPGRLRPPLGLAADHGHVDVRAARVAEHDLVFESENIAREAQASVALFDARGVEAPTSNSWVHRSCALRTGVEVFQAIATAAKLTGPPTQRNFTASNWALVSPVSNRNSNGN